MAMRRPRLPGALVTVGLPPPPSAAELVHGIQTRALYAGSARHRHQDRSGPDRVWRNVFQ